MKFSIITPSYNQGKFLAECIESVLSQSDVQFEHIVIDAGSTDETLEVLQRYPHVKWTSGPDLGMSDGINKGFLKADGDWLMWLNCDDYLLKDALVQVRDYIQRNPNVDIVHGDCVYVTEKGVPIRRKRDTPVDEFDLLFVGCIIPSTSAFYRRKIIDSGELLRADYKNCMDWEYYLRLMRLNYQFGYLPLPLAGFRWHEESTTQKNWQRMIDEGLRAQRAHIEERKFPRVLGSRLALAFLRRIFQGRRVLKRLVAHRCLR